VAAEPWQLDSRPPGPDLDDEWLWRRVRDADGHVADELTYRGFRFLTADSRARTSFVLAARHLSSVPSLQAALEAHVREVTLLDAAPGYDISHSEPRWPHAIFVSSPAELEPASALRLLENVVHEGMHLQLTSLEAKRPLITTGSPGLFSPWKLEERDVQGVLHGVYVFTCISRLFLWPSLLARLNDAEVAYAERRRGEIASELAEVNLDALAGGLNPDGRTLLDRLLASDGLGTRPASPSRS
jgi:HEXXH motif-containing protein